MPAIEEAKDRKGEEAKLVARRAHGLIELIWPNGIVVRVDAEADDRALCSVVAALRTT